MSSEIDLRVSNSLQLLQRIKKTAEECYTKEDQLQRELRTRRHTIDRKYRDDLQRLENDAFSQIAHAEAGFEAASERLRSFFEQRRTRIQRAQTGSLRNLPKRSRIAREKWIGDLQMRKFRAERNQASGLEAVAEAFTKYNTKLAERRDTFITLEQQARKAFGGYGSFRRMLRRGNSEGLEVTPTNLDHWLEQFQLSLQTAEERLHAFRQLLIPRFFRFFPLTLLIPVLFVATVVGAYLLGSTPASYGLFGGIGAGLLTALLVVYVVGQCQGKSIAMAVSEALAEASRLHDPCVAAAEAKRALNLQRVEDEYERAESAIRQQWDHAPDVEADFENAARAKFEEQVPRVYAKNAERLVPKLRAVESERTLKMGALKADADSRKEALVLAHRNETERLLAEEKIRWAALEEEWNQEIMPLFQTLNAMNAEVAAHFPAWNTPLVENWTPALRFTPAAKFARLEWDLSSAAFSNESPNASPKRLQLPGASQISIPLALTFPEQGSLLFETEESSNAAIIDAINNIILRLLATTPPGKLSFTIIDPVGL
ncbi:MAG: hypothetical protein V4710_01580, partial [Verrucomicrobiota bacterium]